MTDNTYRYELKIQGLTNQVAELNNTIMDLRVDLTILSNSLDKAKERVSELESESQKSELDESIQEEI